VFPESLFTIISLLLLYIQGEGRITATLGAKLNTGIPAAIAELMAEVKAVDGDPPNVARMTERPLLEVELTLLTICRTPPRTPNVVPLPVESKILIPTSLVVLETPNLEPPTREAMKVPWP
jgi:hypothetical protein